MNPSVVEMVLGAFMILASCFMIGDKRRLRTKCTLEAEGTVLMVQRKKRNPLKSFDFAHTYEYIALIAYYVNGKKYQFVTDGYVNEFLFAEGQPVTILCNPDKPEEICSALKTTSTKTLIVLMILGLLVFLAGVR